MTTSTDTLLILAAPPEILLGLAILLTVAGLVLVRQRPHCSEHHPV